MRKIYITFLMFALMAALPASATESIKLGFTRTGTDAESVTISVTDENGTAIEGTTASLTASHAFKTTGNAVTESIICPDINGNTSPTIKLTFTIEGLPAGFKFNNINTHIHALNGGGNYQETGDNKARQWNVVALQGATADNLAEFGSLTDIDIAAGIEGANKIWSIASSEDIATENSIVVELTITAGSSNSGCFFGLSELALTYEGEEEEEDTPVVTPDESTTNSIKLGFTRTGTDAESVTIAVTDENGTAIEGATASLNASHAFKATANAVTESIICPNINGNTSPTIKLTFTIEGLPAGFKFNNINTHIHALNGGSNYQETGDNIARQWNVVAQQGATADNLAEFGSLTDIDIAAGIEGANKIWSIAGNEDVATDGSIVVELTITAGSSNSGCFFGLSELALTYEESEDGEGGEDGEEETPTLPEEPDAKIYNISWKTTGGNYITEGSDQSMYIAAYSVTERQFWRFIPTGNENCYYIQNTATGHYIGSCDKTPSSASRISTTTTPVEYYVAPTAATSGEIAGCHYFSSTDCDNYSSESAGPRALNKDGASNYVITWQAGTSRVGSYWKLIETEDLYEIRPFEPSSTLGSIEVSYNITAGSKNISLADGNIALQSKNLADDNQGWYFVGSSNREGYIIASAKDLTTTIAINDGAVTAVPNGEYRWKVYAYEGEEDKFYFKGIESGETLIIEGDSLFTFNKQRNSYARDKQIYNNPCGYLADNYITTAKLHGNDVLSTITYEATSKPANWHVLYTIDRGEVAINGEFTLDITLAQTASSDLEVYAYFDWNADGIFETDQALEVSGNTAAGTFTTPEWAVTTETRMRVRVNENGLNYAEDDVEGVVYDFIITASPAMQNRTVTAGTNAKGRGTATLSEVADEYEKGTTLTATATPSGNNSFICWKEGNIIVSTDAEYTFTVDHNIALTAYFTPDTANGDDIITGIAGATAADIEIITGEGYIKAVSSDAVKSITIYTAGAAQAGNVKGDSISTANLAKGIYIIKVRTAGGEKNFKFYNR